MPSQHTLLLLVLAAALGMSQCTLMIVYFSVMCHMPHITQEVTSHCCSPRRFNSISVDVMHSHMRSLQGINDGRPLATAVGVCACVRGRMPRSGTRAEPSVSRSPTSKVVVHGQLPAWPNCPRLRVTRVLWAHVLVQSPARVAARHVRSARASQRAAVSPSFNTTVTPADSR